MFDAVFNGAIAFQQVSMFIAALFLVCIGGALLGNDIYWRLKALRVQGTVIGVRQKTSTYRPVYSYMLPTGETYEATSNTGSSLVKGKETYSIVPLMVFAEDPLIVCPANSYAALIAGVMFMLPGLALAYFSLTLFPLTLFTWIMLAAITTYGALRFGKLIIPKKDRMPSPQSWKAMRRQKRQEELAKLPIRPIEEILASPEAVAARALEKKNGRLAAPFVLMFALLSLYGGYKQFQESTALESHGLKAVGKVIDIERASGSSDTSYYPIVSFTDGTGKTITFKDRSGSNPPSYSIGEEVNALYLADKPQSSAAIDRGFWNKVIPAVICGFGLLLLMLALKLITT